jgi:hypothetical protein
MFELVKWMGERAGQLVTSIHRDTYATLHD